MVASKFSTLIVTVRFCWIVIKLSYYLELLYIFYKINFMLFYIISSQFWIIQCLAKDLWILVYQLKHCPFLKFAILIDIVTIDTGKYNLVVYTLLSTHLGSRLLIYVKLPKHSSLLSVEAIYLSATWLEREIWDLSGLLISLRFDTRRLLTDYGTFLHPLQKNFPCKGLSESTFSIHNSIVSRKN